MRYLTLSGIRSIRISISLAVFGIVTPAVFLFHSAPSHSQVYLQRVIDYADTMLLYGTDRYGQIHSPQFATALTRDAIPELVIESPKYQSSGSGPDTWPPRFTLLPNVFIDSDYGHKITIRGGDVGTDEQLYKLLYDLSAITGQNSYELAADASLKFFLENAPDPITGLLPWGEHSGWNFRADRRVFGTETMNDGTNWNKHELQTDWDLYDKLAILPVGADNPSLPGNNPLEEFAYGIWNQHVWQIVQGPQTRLRYSRHGEYGNSGNSIAQADKGMFPRHGGYFVDTMSAAYEFTTDSQVQTDLVSFINSFVTEWELQYVEYGYIPFDLPGGDLGNSQNGDLAKQLRESAPRLMANESTLALRMIELADNINSLKKAYESVGNLMTSGINNRSLGKNSNHTSHPDWTIGWDLPGKVPSQYAQVIAKLVDAAIENDPSAPHSRANYLERAIHFADEAIDLFLEDGTGSKLPRMLDKNSPIVLLDGITTAPAFYHSYTGGDDLMLELLRLDEALSIFDIPVFADLNGDRLVDAADWVIYIAGLDQNLSGLTSEQRLMMGDLNDDGFNDFTDFTLFKNAFDSANGHGTFAGLLKSVPEPSSYLIASLVLSLILTTRSTQQAINS